MKKIIIGPEIWLPVGFVLSMISSRIVKLNFPHENQALAFVAIMNVFLLFIFVLGKPQKQ
jgi:hypothetical protein